MAQNILMTETPMWRSFRIVELMCAGLVVNLFQRQVR